MRFTRLAVLPALFALVFSLLASFVLVSPPKTLAAGAADADARELVRLINGARAASGRSTLPIDLFLASKARDGAIPCPDDSSKTIAGRTRDFSATGQMSHYLRKCDTATYTLSSKTFVAQLQSWGYGTVGEILLVNGGYGNYKYLYTYKSFSTYTYSTTAHAMTGWASSSSHWSIIMGTYDRVGCGAWSPAGSTIYYDCVFSRGGPSPSGLAAPPTTSPFSGSVPTAAATPVRTSGSGSGSGSGGGGGSGSGGQRPPSVAAAATTFGSSIGPSPSLTPSPSPTPSPSASPSAAATPIVLAQEMAFAGGSGRTVDQGVIVVSGVALLGGASAVLLFLGRKTRRSP